MNSDTPHHSPADPLPESDSGNPAMLFILTGMASIIVGGLVSAATASAPSRLSAWLVAYLVLVAGAAQVGLGAGQCRLASEKPSRSVLGTEFLVFNLGNLAVIGGSLFSVPLLVDAGGLALVLALVFFLRTGRTEGASGWTQRVYGILVMLLLGSIPIGLILAHFRAG